jgi:hypothetical protein
MGKPKKKNVVLDFAKGFLGDQKNKAPAAKFVQGVNKRNEQLKKLGY